MGKSSTRVQGVGRGKIGLGEAKLGLAARACEFSDFSLRRNSRLAQKKVQAKKSIWSWFEEIVGRFPKSWNISRESIRQFSSSRKNFPTTFQCLRNSLHNWKFFHFLNIFLLFQEKQEDLKLALEIASQSPIDQSTRATMEFLEKVNKMSKHFTAN